MLRAHSIERTQQRGPYNVFSVLKPKTQDGTTKVSLSAERIRDIFEQHPLVKRVYDENVPKVLRSLKGTLLRVSYLKMLFGVDFSRLD